MNILVVWNLILTFYIIWLIKKVKKQENRNKDFLDRYTEIKKEEIANKYKVLDEAYFPLKTQNEIYKLENEIHEIKSRIKYYEKFKD